MIFRIVTAILLLWVTAVTLVQASNADRELSRRLEGAWFIDGTVSENITGNGVIEFHRTGTATYVVELYLSGYLLERIEHESLWEVQDSYLKVRAHEDHKNDSYGLVKRAEQEPIKVLSINRDRLICETKNYGVLVFKRHEGQQSTGK